MSVPKLVGVCNQCGLCCVANGFRCENLVRIGPLGSPNATFCTKQQLRWDNMPILLRDSLGKVVEGICPKDSLLEVVAIVARGFGRGCSLQL